MSILLTYLQKGDVGKTWVSLTKYPETKKKGREMRLENMEKTIERYGKFVPL